MTAVDKPKNNLQQHLAWFNSHNPQIPPRGQRLPLTANNIILSSASVNTAITQLLPVQNPLTRAPIMPTPAHMRNSTLTAPRRSETKPKLQEIEVVSFESPSTSKTVKEKTITEKVKRDFPQGMEFNFRFNCPGLQTPITQGNIVTPSTRETVDLTFDDETDTIIKKKEPSTLPDLVPHYSNPQQTVTVRKRQKNEEVQDGTQSRPPPKRQKSPGGAIIQPTRYISPEPAKCSISSSILLPATPPRDSFTQIPDSEGEDEELCYGDDFGSDDIPLDTKEILRATPAEIGPQIQQADIENRQEHIVPESPLKFDEGDNVELETSKVQPFKPHQNLRSDNPLTAPITSRTWPSANNLSVTSVVPRTLPPETIISSNAAKAVIASKVRPSNISNV